MLLAVRISSYGCTWEVWRALKKLSMNQLSIRRVIRLRLLMHVRRKIRLKTALFKQLRLNNTTVIIITFAVFPLYMHVMEK